MTNKEEDRRVVKTRQVIQDALFNLMQEKPYHKITIQDVIDRANVGRSTFYSHYETKEDLLLNCIEHLLKMLNRYLINYLERKEDGVRLLPVTELFDHIKENIKLMKGLMKTDSSDLFFDKVKAYWNKSIEEYLTAKLPAGAKPPVPIEILTDHITSTLINLMKWWISNKMLYSSRQMDEYYQQLINPCIDSMIRSPIYP